MKKYIFVSSLFLCIVQTSLSVKIVNKSGELIQVSITKITEDTEKTGEKIARFGLKDNQSYTMPDSSFNFTHNLRYYAFYKNTSQQITKPQQVITIKD